MDENIATKILKRSPILEVVGRSKKIGVLLLYLPDYTWSAWKELFLTTEKFREKGSWGTSPC